MSSTPPGTPEHDPQNQPYSEQEFSAPQSPYGDQQPQYGAQPEGYGDPQARYGVSAQGYAEPQPQYGAEPQFGSQPQYAAPQAFGAPPEQGMPHAYPGQQAWGQQPAGYPSGGQNPAPAPKKPGFFGALFDFSFRTSVAETSATIIFVVAIVAIALNWLIDVISGFAWTFGDGFGQFLGGGVMALFQIILVRVLLEIAVAIVRTAKNTARGTDSTTERADAEHAERY